MELRTFYSLKEFLKKVPWGLLINSFIPLVVCMHIHVFAHVRVYEYFGFE